MTQPNSMHQLFAEWPAAIERKGTVITSWGDSVPFVDYMLNGDLLLLIRSQPDAHGTRRLIMSINDVNGIRIMEAIDPHRFQAMGFQPIG